MMATVNNSGIAQEGTISSASLHTITGNMYRAACGGSLPPDQFVVVRYSVLTEYQMLIGELEERLSTYKQFIAEGLHSRNFLREPEDRQTDSLDASSAAIVSALLSSVKESHFYRDDVEDI